ncbi:MAG: glycoside hydrolase family 2 protein, partial [Anaerolineae bacterium]|nr:glycoside hydrolase family 2 protein [Anaerolineae bacterium]
MRTVVSFNDNWLYCSDDVPASTPDSVFEPVTLPHTNLTLPHHNFDNAEYQFVSTYRKRFALPEPRAGRRVYVDFDGAMIASTISINGHAFPEYKGGYTPFVFDITDYVQDEGENLLTVRLDSSERPDIPPYGYVVDYLTFGGIYRDVRLRYVEPIHITDVFVRPQDVLNDAIGLEVDVTVANQGAASASLEVRAQLLDASPLAAGSTVHLDAGAAQTLTLVFAPLAVGDVKLWSPDDPALYDLSVKLIGSDGLLDAQTARFGFREAMFTKDTGFVFNGERLDLIGLNRHQTYPYVGAAAPARLQRRDADIIKYDLGCNIVRTSHYPQSPHFLDRCDEIGLLVFEEIPGWQHIGDADWKALSLRNVEKMITRDRNHPAIVLWGVRINESGDDHDFYTATNALAHRLDPTRQTGGVRYQIESEFLEDVFTFNDFSNNVREPIHAPHFITEFNGHMFPTKTWDQEERVVEHALRHARIQDLQMGNPRVSGAIGWCAFDYNTHQEFGSGDHICYHGVMDIFRLPKWAASVYTSQVDPVQRIALQVASLWTMGDRNAGGINPLMIFSNCDEVEVFVGAESYGRFLPDRAAFPHLPHAPFTIQMPGGHFTWGRDLADLRVVGYLNGAAVAEQLIAADGMPAALEVTLDDAELIGDGADMTRLAFRI